MGRVIHFEIHADDPERAMRFYRELLGWEFSGWGGSDEYWMVRTGPDAQPGINGGLIRRKGQQSGDAVTAYVCTVEVAALDDRMSAAENSGGQIVVPKRAIPGFGWLAYAKDPEGNIFGMTQIDPMAA
ncbi:MAG: VOC family protein [Candidatus Eiseniibacteriota bacterium]